MEKISWWENIESHLFLQVIIFMHWLVILKDRWRAQFLDFMKLKAMIPLWPLQICLEPLLIYTHLKMEMEEFAG